MQPWHTPFPIWKQFVFPCSVLTIASWPADRLRRRQARWRGIPISLRIFRSLLWSTVKGFGVVNKADVFLEFSCLFCDSTDVGNLISGSSAFSKSSSNIWKFMVHVLLELREFWALHFASMWDQCNCVIVWIIFGIAFFGIGMCTDLFKSCGHCWVFLICWHMV